MDNTKFNIHDWQDKQRRSLFEQDDRPDNWRELPGYNPDAFYGPDSIMNKDKVADQTSMSNADIGALQTVVGNNSLNKVLNTLAVIANKAGKHDEADDIEKLADQIQDFPTDMDEMNTTGTGASFNADSGEGYMTPNAFKKKRKTNEQEESDNMTDDQLAQWRKDNLGGPGKEEPTDTHSDLSKDVELMLRYSDRINTRIEWEELFKTIMDLDVQGTTQAFKVQVLRKTMQNIQKK